MNNGIRLRKEYKITPTSKNFKASFGTTNRLSPTVIYIKVDTWVNYIGNAKEYSDKVSILNSNVKNSIKTEIRKDNSFDSLFFYTPEIKKLLTNDKRFHAHFELTIKQNDPISSNILLLSDKIESMVNTMIEMMEKNSEFEFNTKKCD